MSPSDESLFVGIGRSLQEQEEAARIERVLASQKIQRDKPLKAFVAAATELIWQYSPDIQIRDYSIKYSYPYLEPGRTSIPPVPYVTESGESLVLVVEAEYIVNPKPDAHPDSVRIRKIGIRFQSDSRNDLLVVEFDSENNPVEETRPSNEDLATGIKMLEYIGQKHKALKTERAPQGHSDPG